MDNGNDNGSGTVFDSVFKTMVRKAPRLLIPFINEVFGRNYSTRDTKERWWTTRYFALGTRSTT